MPTTRSKSSHTAAPDWTGLWLRSLRRRLLTWFRRHARDLAWRRTSDPYAIWVSEIMLQQTQVATVERYFPRFLAEFPSIAALAAASEQRVLRQWEGLGYYRRARQLHRAAKVIATDHGGRFPSDVNVVRTLPGIGRYTAGAILSIAFDQRQPILEANTIRLFSRLLAYAGDTASRDGQYRLWRAAEALLPARGSGEINQALMELGSLVCTPRAPNCSACPLENLCPTRRAGLQQSIPAPRQPFKLTDVCEVAVVVAHRGKLLLRRCAEGERWAGLWDFPRFAQPAGAANGRSRAIARGVLNMTGVAVADLEHLATLRHGVTRFRITLDCYTASCRSTQAARRDGELSWIDSQQLDQYPLSTTGRKLAKIWRQRAGQLQ